MKRAEIDKIYTTKVAEYISKGYTMHTETMADYQGETARTDLIKGSELIRVYCDTHADFPLDDAHNYFTIITGKVPADQVNDNLIFMKDLEIIDQQEFIELLESEQPKEYITKQEYLRQKAEIK